MMLRRVVPGQVNAVGEDDVEVVLSTNMLARDGHVLEPGGCILDNYRRNPIWLFAHDTKQPVGRASDFQVEADKIRCIVTFAPIGVSADADRTRGLVKAGIITAISVGFDPIKMEPIDRAKPRGGQHITSWELLECSFVSVPVDTGATVTARALEDAVKEHEPMTEAKPDPAEARTRHLDDCRTRMLATPETPKRGLYELAMLCSVMSGLGYVQDDAAWEAEIEQDNSAVPAMLGEALSAVGKALIAMAAEEVAEALEGVAGAGAEAGTRAKAWRAARAATAPLPQGQDHDIVIRGAVSAEQLEAFKRDWTATLMRAGKMISAENHAALTDAHDEITRGCAKVKSVLDKASATDEPDDSAARAAAVPDATYEYRKRQRDKLALAAVAAE